MVWLCPEQREGAEPADGEQADGEAAVVRRELHHDPRHRDVLHPGSGHRGELACEEESIVAVTAEGGEGPG